MYKLMSRHPFTFLIHLALAIILAGATVTHFFGIQGELSLSEGSRATTFDKTSGPGSGTFPFLVELEAADIDFYPGTTTPMDFRSHLVVDGKPVTVSMNNVASIDGWRFYQSGISQGSTRLSISHDPWGTGITYVGYALLLVGMLGFFSQRGTLWRSLLRSGRKALPMVLLFCALDANATDSCPLPVMQRPLAANMGKVYVYWNGRVCPLQTMAKDVCLKLYGRESYCGLSPEQVLSGWLFYFDTWERHYLSMQDKGEKRAGRQKLYGERLALVRWMGSGEAFKIYPYRTVSGRMEWLSLTGRRPSQMSLGQWEFMQVTMPRIKGYLLSGHNIDANSAIEDLMAGQVLYAGSENLPTPARMRAEIFYNHYASLLPLAVLSLLAGLFYLYVAIRGCRVGKVVWAGVGLTVAMLLSGVAAVLGLLWWISGHVPLSNGPETMLFMGFFAFLCSLACRKGMLRGAFLIVASMALFVGAMGSRTPRVGMLVPVLSSPLLSIHVVLVMTSYVFFMIMAVLAAIGLSVGRKSTDESLYRVNRVILTPAVFLLAAGIFVGAVWANQSWGRYWGWDPKETCALVMLLVYSVPLHLGVRQCKVFRNPKVMQWYLLCAVLSVAFTYFGANYFLPGLHSYM